jgi:hypothetical protein
VASRTVIGAAGRGALHPATGAPSNRRRQEVETVSALAGAALAAALLVAPVPPAPAHTTRPCQQSLEGRKGGAAPPVAVTQRYHLTLPGSPQPVTGLHASFADRDNPEPVRDSAPPSPGMIALLTVLALVGAGVLLVAPRWLRGR